MTDSATTARKPESGLAKDSSHVLERIEAWVEEHPEATDYYIANELEAEQILLAMAATIKLLAKDVKVPADRRVMLDVANGYRNAVANGKALETFRNMTEEDQLELYGVRLRAQRILVQ